MSDDVPAEPVRIGHAERQAATNALKQHHEAGRIDSQEYEERSVKAQAARSMQELEALFTDLPQPHVTVTEVSGPAASGQASAAGDSAARSAADVEPATHGVLNLPEPLAATVVSITPILAVVLFFVTHTWLWFLAIPVVAVLVYGPDGRPGTGPEAARRTKRKK